MNTPDSWDIVSGVGITALGVAAARAMESTRSDALIDDPYAESFVTRAHSAIPLPTSWASVEDSAQRSEDDQLWASFWAGMATYVGVRSRFFDEYFLDVSHAGIRQVVILAAGWPKDCSPTYRAQPSRHCSPMCTGAPPPAAG